MIIKREGVQMSINAISNKDKTVDIFYNPNELGKRGINAGFHVRRKGQKGFPLIMGDCNYKTPDDALKSALDFLNKGFTIENIRINGQPITDKFQQGKDGKYEPITRHAGDTFIK